MSREARKRFCMEMNRGALKWLLQTCGQERSL